ncbi:hydroxysteroid dehydrogenase-like protein 1 isoform X1 [Drosophila biarmipes]|uniref:hydroxysteroid dehydrogenase-like protein 1 isoform X1 n=1 Tax=Drosophila biarmipes TaxID=125945 RepID=UPI0007E685F5|nr:hydroxysteroid dehydrogenase-like protein 1 isoform X1 [Drosophila biarmipes]
MFCALSTFLTVIGFYALASYLYEQLRTPYKLLKLRYFSDNRPTLKERYGDWAAVTGASDGIGKEYAKELARQNINVVLIARNAEKLQAVAKEIAESGSSVQTKIVVADFTKGSQIYEHIEKETADVPISILVNNVGTGRPSSILKWSQEDTQNILDTNVVAVSQLSRVFFQRMKASRIRGAIVNVSSGTELQPLPYGAYYAASKAYTRSLTLALYHEAKPFGIHVQLLSPNFVVTKINSYSRQIMKGGLFIPSASAYAKSAVDQLRDGVDETPGYLWHHVQNALATAFTWRARTFAAYKMFNRVSDKNRH